METRAVGSILQVVLRRLSVRAARVDIDPTVPGVNVAADMLDLPFLDRAWDTVACDPMYDLGYQQRVLLQREVIRVARRRLLFRAPWIPRAHGWVLHEALLLASSTCANVAALSVLERDLGQRPLFRRSHESPPRRPTPSKPWPRCRRCSPGAGPAAACDRPAHAGSSPRSRRRRSRS